MASVNRVILIGNLGQDPSIRYMSNGEAVANITLATTDTWKDKNGDKQEKTEWHRIVFYRKLAEIAGEYLKKGSAVYIEGKIETKKWTDKNGMDRYTTGIIATEMRMLGSKKNSENENESASENQSVPSTGTGFDDMDDDIPF